MELGSGFRIPQANVSPIPDILFPFHEASAQILRLSNSQYFVVKNKTIMKRFSAKSAASHILEIKR